MSDTPQHPPQTITVGVAETPTVYCNQVACSISYSDIRLYVSEVVPESVDFGPRRGFKTRPPHIRPQICVVLTPEFSRTVLNNLRECVERYEKAFGALRPEPTLEQAQSALNDLQSKK